MRFFLFACTIGVLALTLTLVSFRADDGFAAKLIEQLSAYMRQRPTEKVHVQTDRDVYVPGETVWLKGYLFNGINHETDSVSRVLYVDLVDPSARQVRVRAQLRAMGGYAPGQFTLSDSIPDGTYVLQAYTNFMRNYPADYYFTKTLTVLRGTTNPERPVSRSGAKPDLQFMPEGGALVAGVQSRVAFKAVDVTGRGVSITGYVVNNSKDTLTGFTSQHLGMGFFSILPVAGQTYTAYVQTGDGPLFAYPLPAAAAEGATLQVDNLSNRDKVRIFVQHNFAGQTGAMTLIAQSRGIISQTAQVPLARKTSSILMPRNQFAEGITQLTLFDSENRPICERLIFVDRNERMHIQLTSNKSTYKKRERIDLTITTTDATGKPVPANLSLSALDEQLTPRTDSAGQTIVSSLLLTSDLVGTIEQPGYYFDPTHDDRAHKLDLLLMTQGWRRFVWTDVMAGKIPPIVYPVEQGLSLTGQVRRPNQKETGTPVKLTFLLAKRDSTREFLSGESDAAGRYGAYDLNFVDTTTVLIQAVKGKANRDLTISLDQLLRPTVTLTKVPYNPLEIRRDELAEFIRRTNEYLEIERQIRNNREILLNAVTVRAKRAEVVDSRKIYGRADATVKFDQTNTAGRLTVLDVIQGRVAGVQVSGSGFGAQVQIRGAANFGGAIAPLFILDGMPVDLQTINSISIQDVDQVDVLKGASAAIYGSQAAGGVIVVLTKRGTPNYDLLKEAAPGTLVAKLPGYTPVREFYAPRYDVVSKEPIRPDYRVTLCWMPMIQTDATGKATLSFFTSDNKAAIRVKVEGTTVDGMTGVGQQQIHTE
jgi:TonB-dependent SusC/RagA subfamily outer membrane receptor